MQEPQFPIWDQTGTHTLRNDDGTDMMLSESAVRRLIGSRKLGVWRSRQSNGERKIVLREEEHAVFPRSERRIDPAQPFCVRITVGEHFHSFMHVRERCVAAYDGRSLCIGSDGNGNRIYTKQGISASAL